MGGKKPLGILICGLGFLIRDDLETRVVEAEIKVGGRAAGAGNNLRRVDKGTRHDAHAKPATVIACKQISRFDHQKRVGYKSRG